MLQSVRGALCVCCERRGLGVLCCAVCADVSAAVCKKIALQEKNQFKNHGPADKTFLGFSSEGVEPLSVSRVTH